MVIDESLASSRTAITVIPHIQVGVLRDMPVYSPAYAGYSFQPGQAQAE